MSKSKGAVQDNAPLEEDMPVDTPKMRDKSVQPGNSELDHIRNILFGEQVQIVGQRLDDLEIQLGATRRELMDEIKSQFELAGNTNAGQIADVEKSFSTQLEKQDGVHTNQLGAVQSGLTEQIEMASNKLKSELQQTRKEFTDNHKTLSAEFAERLHTLQTEMQQRDDNLRQELLAVTAQLEKHKADRTDLGQMLINLGHQLQATGSIDSEKDSSNA